MNFWLVIWKLELLYLSIDLVSPKVSIHYILRHGYQILLVNKLVSDLNWKTVVQIPDASLANVFHFGASLTYLCFFIPCIVPRFPSKNSEGSRTDFALSCKITFSHSNIRIFTQTIFTNNWKIRIFPTLFVDT